MFFEHTRASVAHNGTYFVAFIRSVTVVAACFTRGFLIHVAASFGTEYGVGIDFCTGGTDWLAAVGVGCL